MIIDKYMVFGFVIGLLSVLLIYMVSETVKEKLKNLKKLKTTNEEDVLVGISGVEKDIDVDARFFVVAEYKSGKKEFINKKPLTEDQVESEIEAFLKAYNNR